MRGPLSRHVGVVLAMAGSLLAMAACSGKSSRVAGPGGSAGGGRTVLETSSPVAGQGGSAGDGQTGSGTSSQVAGPGGSAGGSPTVLETSSRVAGQGGSAGSGQAGSLGSGGAAGGSEGSSTRSPADAGLRVDGAGSEARATKACTDAIIAQCERAKMCTTGAEQDCAQYAADRCPEYYFGPHSLRTVENVEACLPLLRQASCTDFQMSLSSQCLLGGLGNDDAPCTGASECASNWCLGAGSRSCGTCGPSAALGEPCSSQIPHCVSGTVCHPATKVCVPAPLVIPRAKVGEPCSLKVEPLVGCEGDLMCVPATSDDTTGKCTPFPRQGEPCLPVRPSCAPGLACGTSTAGGQLTSLCGNPVPCGTEFCDTDSFCYEKPTGSYHCVRYLRIGEDCLPMDNADRRCPPASECVPQGSSADGGYSITCLIRREQVDLGESCAAANTTCRSPFRCQSGRCVRFDPALCHEPKDAGSGRE
jgi:hypothetical protein